MTDYNKYKELLKSWGVEFNELKREDFDFPGITINDLEGSKSIYITAGYEKVEGYFGSFSQAVFDKNGKFIMFIVGE
jgi:hypothetical protein